MMLPKYVKNIGYRMLAERKNQLEHLTTIEDVKKRGAYLRERMLADVGGFPEKTALNARVVGTLERSKYRIEKILFESQPHFYVTANLYLTKTGQQTYTVFLFNIRQVRGIKTTHIRQHKTLRS